MPTDPTWGQFANAWGGEENILVGGAFSTCAGEAYLTQNQKEVSGDGTVNNYMDLDNFWNNAVGAKEYLAGELDLDASTATVDDWITAWESNKETQEAFILTVNCMNAKTLAAGIATVAAAVYATI